MKTVNSLVLAALAAALPFQTPIALAADHGPERITFQKCFVADDSPFGGHLEGPVSGDCGVGTVVFNYLSISPAKAIWQFSGEYVVATDACSFTAVCSGIVDVRTGHVVLNGVVTVGDNLGASVQVRAQANADLSCSEGTITITPN